jgi:hypothetical protein
MTKTVWQRIGLAYLAGGYALVGFWAAFAPRSFYTDFPGGGRHWVSPDGPYNQHLVRDVGELNLALLVVMVAAAVTLSRPLVRAALAATIVNGVLHVVYHAGHVDMFSTSDQVAILATLALAPVVAVVLLVSTRSVTPSPVVPVSPVPSSG